MKLYRKVHDMIVKLAFEIGVTVAFIAFALLIANLIDRGL